MLIKRGLPSLLSTLTVLALVGSAVAAPDYPTNYAWDRGDDWVDYDSSHDGTVSGNPTPDGLSGPAWGYGYTEGGSLDSENPWYAQEIMPLVWNDTRGLWDRDNGAYPNISSLEVTHLTFGGHYQYVPVVQWHNPTEHTVVIEIDGSIGLFPRGWYVGTAEYVIAHRTADDTTPLFSGSIELDDSAGPNWNLVDLPTVLSVVMAPEDSLLISVRGMEETNGWVSLNDNGAMADPLQFRLAGLLPEPASLSVLGLGGLLIRVRRRR